MHSLFGGFQKSVESIFERALKDGAGGPPADTETAAGDKIGSNTDKPVAEEKPQDEAAKIDDGPSPTVTTPNEEAEAQSRKLYEEAALNPTLIANKFISFARTTSNKIQNKAIHLSTMVNERTPIANLEKERQKFREELSGGKSAISEKWAGILEDKEAREHIISLSQNPKNFLEDAPVSSAENSKLEEIQGMAGELLKIDPNLAKMRFKLVPKQISEQKFWHNYAYRLSLIAKLFEKNKGQIDAANVKEVVGEELKPETSTQAPGKAEDKGKSGEDRAKSAAAEVEESSVDDELEKELLSDLGDYEMVGNGGGGSKKDERSQSDENWEDEIDDLLKENLEEENKK